MLKQVARGVDCYHIVDGSGKMYGIESTYNNFEVLTPQRDIFSHSNNYVTERFKACDTAPVIQPDSFDRQNTIGELISQQYGHITAETAMELLADHHHVPISSAATSTKPCRFRRRRWPRSLCGLEKLTSRLVGCAGPTRQGA